MEAEALPTLDDADQSTGGEEEPAPKQDALHKVPFMADLEKPSMEPLSVASASSTRKEENHHQEQRIKMVKVEMSEARQENERLKRSLDEIMKDYEVLKRQFHEITKKEGKKTTQKSANPINNDKFEEIEDMVSLTLGRFSSDQNKKDHKMLELNQDLGSIGVGEIRNYNKTLSMENLQSPTDSEQAKDEEAGETSWPPSKISKNTPTPATGEDEVSEQNNPPKKTRVCVRVQCDTPTLNDGCQWRKYGQKIAKGNPCPRAYYRCTGAPSCPVRKQVQRSMDDMSILIITYEGTHNHPLPVSAMAMASTTSAAASMLLSGASSSTSRLSLNPSPIGTTTVNLHGMNMYLTNNTNSNQLYLPSSSMLSSSLSHPTITLDLTSNPPSTSSSSPFHKIPSTYPSKYPFTSLDFSSSQPNFMSWNNNTSSGYANNNQAYNISKNAIGMSSDLTKQLPPHSSLYGAYLQQFTKPSTPPPLPPPPPPDTIAAATKAITSDPSFQSALVAALSSIISSRNGGEAEQPIASNVQAAQAAPPLTCSTSKSSSSPSGGSRDNNTK